MRQLSGIDAGFLYMESADTPMQVGGVYLFQPAPGREHCFFEDYQALVRRRLHLAPILRMKLATMPLSLDHPVWVEDDAFELDNHIRRMGLPHPGTMAQLEELIAQLHAVPLDRSRPLWEFTVIDGLQTGQAVLYTKVHHAAIDGGAGIALTQTLYDTTPEPRELPAAPAMREPASGGTHAPGMLGLLGEAFGHHLRQEARLLRGIPDLYRSVARWLLPEAKAPDGGGGGGLPSLPALPPPRTILNGTVTRERSYAARLGSLDDARRIAHACGVKVNDVVLAACGAALRRYLRERNALPAQSLTAFVPVSLRELGDTEANNQVFAMVSSLATDVADPLARLRAVAEGARGAKQLTARLKDLVPQDYAVLGAPLLLQGLLGLYGRLGLADEVPAIANVVVSNVPGPPMPLYMSGARMLTMYPVSIPWHGMAVNITVQSYEHALDFGVIACRRILPDAHRLGDYLVEALDELRVAALGADSVATPPLEARLAAALVPHTAPAASATPAPAKPSPRRRTARRALASSGRG